MAGAAWGPGSPPQRTPVAIRVAANSEDGNGRGFRMYRTLARTPVIRDHLAASDVSRWRKQLVRTLHSRRVELLFIALLLFDVICVCSEILIGFHVLRLRLDVCDDKLATCKAGSNSTAEGAHSTAAVAHATDDSSRHRAGSSADVNMPWYKWEEAKIRNSRSRRTNPGTNLTLDFFAKRQQRSQCEARLLSDKIDCTAARSSPARCALCCYAYPWRTHPLIPLHLHQKVHPIMLVVHRPRLGVMLDEVLLGV